MDLDKLKAVGLSVLIVGSLATMIPITVEKYKQNKELKENCELIGEFLIVKAWDCGEDYERAD